MLGSVLGVTEVRDAWRAYGREAEVVALAAVPWLPQHLLATDRQLVEVRGSPVALVSLRLQGMVGPRALFSARAFSLRIGGLPVARRDVLPIQLHFLVRRRPDPSLAAHLVQLGQGWFSRARTGLGWEGPLAGRLTAEAGLLDVLEPEIGPGDGLVVKPETDLVRIVLKRTIVVHLGLAAGPDLARVDRPVLGDGLLRAIETIARVVLGPS